MQQYFIDTTKAPSYGEVRAFLDGYGKDEDVPDHVSDFREKYCPVLRRPKDEIFEYFQIVLDETPSDEEVETHKNWIEIEIKKDFIVTAIGMRYAKTIYDDLYGNRINDEKVLGDIFADRPHANFPTLADQFYNKSYGNTLTKIIRFDDVNEFMDTIRITDNGKDLLNLNESENEYLCLVIEELMKYNAIKCWKWLLSTFHDDVMRTVKNPKFVYTSICNSLEILQIIKQEDASLFNTDGILLKSAWWSSLLAFDKQLYEWVYELNPDCDKAYSVKFTSSEGSGAIEIRDEIFTLIDSEYE